mgnify:CR=1 FL=1
MDERELLKIAEESKEKAYAPYSGFRVGAAVLTENGKVFTGVNIENASYGATNCAERTAVFKAVSEGEKSISAIAVTSDSESFTYPCGICRQVISEFGGKSTKVICGRRDGGFETYTLEELLPNAFLRHGNKF